jgi:hypothetical protein
MAKVQVSIVHKITGEIVAVSTSAVSIGGATLKGITIGGPDELVIDAEVEEKDLASLLATHIVEGQKLRARDG